MNKKNHLKNEGQRKIHIEQFPLLTTELILTIINKMSDEEIYYWIEIEEGQKLITKMIRQFCSENKLSKILKEIKADNESKEVDYREELLVKMYELDKVEGLKNEVDVIL